MERRGGFEALREVRSHSQLPWGQQSQSMSEGRLPGELRQEAEAQGVERGQGKPATGSFKQSAWLPRITRIKGYLWKALSLLSAALKAESYGIDFYLCQEGGPERTETYPKVTQ